MEQILEIYQTANQRIEDALLPGASADAKRTAIGYVFNTLTNNPLISVSLKVGVEREQARYGNNIPDDGLDVVLKQLRPKISGPYERVKKEVEEDVQLAQQPVPEDNPAMSVARNMINRIEGAGDRDMSISKAKWLTRILLSKINEKQNELPAMITQTIAPALQQRLQTAETTDNDSKRVYLVAGIFGGLKSELKKIVEQEQAPNDVEMAADNGGRRKRRRGKKTKKTKKNKRYTRRR